MPRIRMPRTSAARARAGAALAVATLALGVAGCGGDDDPVGSGDDAPTATTDHNAADVDFATQMIPHHAQALVMVDMTQGRDLDPAVRTLVEGIRAAQAPEIETMSDWLTDWGEEVPETMRDHMHAGHGDDSSSDAESDMEGMAGMDDDMPGMMSAEEMGDLERAKGADFQTMWLEMMIEHHEGAVEMAETEQDEGRYPDAIDLAGHIIDSQTQEIDTMHSLLGD